MPRTRRIISPVDTYHIMLRGVNHQQIFEEESDFIKFLSIIKTCQQISNFSIHAYCIMGNHIHLLLTVKGEPLGQCLKRIENRFVFWYNSKYERIGPLFQGRFKSEAISDRSYLLNVWRYIHQNPVKAGICQKMEQYPWSSIHAYCGTPDDLTDISLVSSLFPDSSALYKFLFQPSEQSFLDIDPIPKNTLTDEEAKKIIYQLTGCASPSEFQKLDRIRRDFSVKTMRKRGLSTYQINRLTGISRALIYKIIKQSS